MMPVNIIEVGCHTTWRFFFFKGSRPWGFWRACYLLLPGLVLIYLKIHLHNHASSSDFMICISQHFKLETAICEKKELAKAKVLALKVFSFILLPANHNPSHDWNDQQVIIFDKGFVTSLINNDFQETNCHQRGKLTRLRKKYCALLELWVILPINLKSFNVLW